MHDVPASPGGPPGGLVISRRQALVGALGAVAGGTALVAADRASAARVPSAGRHPVFRRSRFAALVGRTIDVVDHPGARLKLERIHDISDGRGGLAVGHEDAFALSLRQVRGPTLPSGVMTLALPGAGPVPMLVSASSPVHRRRYHAVVNRLRP